MLMVAMAVIVTNVFKLMIVSIASDILIAMTHFIRKCARSVLVLRRPAEWCGEGRVM